MKPELIADYECLLGESPIWHPLEQRLYWTDITRGKLFRYDPETDRHEQCYSGTPVGGFTIQTDGALLLFMQRGAIATWRDGQLNFIVEEIRDEQESRFNDVIADPEGRIFCGTMPTPARSGRLYRLDTDGSLHLILEGIGCSNGMGFTLDRRCMYYTDSNARCIYLFDYDNKTGSLSNQRVWLQTPEGQGVPDGLTVDKQGYVWSARWDGSAVYRYTPDAAEVLRIDFPAKKVTSLVFGGHELNDIYVTTALGESTKAEEGTGAGGLFRARSGTTGVPEFFSQVRV